MRRVLLVTILAALLLGSVGQAGAHTTLISEAPARGDEVIELTEIVLEFETAIVADADMRLVLATVGEGVEIPIGTAEVVDDFILRADVPNAPEPGDYIVRYQVTSIDTDLNDGGYAFTLLKPQSAGAAWILLVVGVIAVGLVFAMLRPKSSARAASTS